MRRKDDPELYLEDSEGQMLMVKALADKWDRKEQTEGKKEKNTQGGYKSDVVERKFGLEGRKGMWVKKDQGRDRDRGKVAGSSKRKRGKGKVLGVARDQNQTGDRKKFMFP